MFHRLSFNGATGQLLARPLDDPLRAVRAANLFLLAAGPWRVPFTLPTSIASALFAVTRQRKY